MLGVSRIIHPIYLSRLSPALYREEAAQRGFNKKRPARRTDVPGGAERSGRPLERARPGGKPKIFRDSAVENLTEFFERFRLHLGGEDQLEETVRVPHKAALLGVDARRLQQSARVCGSGSSRTSQRSVELDEQLVEAAAAPRDASSVIHFQTKQL